MKRKLYRVTLELYFATEPERCAEPEGWAMTMLEDSDACIAFGGDVEEVETTDTSVDTAHEFAVIPRVDLAAEYFDNVT